MYSTFRRPRRSVASSLVCTLLALVLAWKPVLLRAAEQLPNLGDAASDDLSPLQERKLGEEIMREAREQGDVYDDPESTEYLNRFGEILIQHAPPSPQSFEFFLVDDSDINAFALPGGFIGINTGLIISTQTEGELASVMAHEMGHVIQHHIARGAQEDKQASLIALAASILGMIAMAKSSNPSGGEATVMMSQNYLIQTELAFSRNAEREADRVGFQILQNSGFDPNSMTSFFAHLQKATEIYEGGTPEWARDHPMTSERIADIQNRIGDAHYRQRADSVDFQLVRARLRALQETTVQGMTDARTVFQDQLHTGNYASEAAIRYGLSIVLMRQNDLSGAQRELDRAEAVLKEPNAMLLAQGIQIKIAKKDSAGAVALAEAALNQFPQSRALVGYYAETLETAGRYEDEIRFLRDQVAMYRSEPRLYQLLAKDYAAKGAAMQEHQALAENYYLRGSVSAAIEQLQFARRASNGDFYELSQIDARLRELQAEWLDIKKDKSDYGKTVLGGSFCIANGCATN
jgi:beta-barrel assembly-enhancing protease